MGTGDWAIQADNTLQKTNMMLVVKTYVHMFITLFTGKGDQLEIFKKEILYKSAYTVTTLSH